MIAGWRYLSNYEEVRLLSTDPLTKALLATTTKWDLSYYLVHFFYFKWETTDQVPPGKFAQKKAPWLVALSHPSFMPRQWRTRPRKQRRRRISTMLAWSQNQLRGWSNDRCGPPWHIEDVKVLCLDQFKGFFFFSSGHTQCVAVCWSLKSVLGHLYVCIYCIYTHTSILRLFKNK